MTGVSDKSKPYKEKVLRGDLSLCHFWHTNIGGVRVWGQMCVWVAKPNKSVRLFSHTTAVVVLLFLQCVLSGGRLDYIAFRRIL